MKKKLLMLLAFLGLTVGIVSPTMLANATSHQGDYGIATYSATLPGSNITQDDIDYYFGETTFICKTEAFEDLPKIKNYTLYSSNHEYGPNFVQTSADDVVFYPEDHNGPDFNMNNHCMRINESQQNVLIIFGKDQATVESFTATEGVRFIELNVYTCDNSEGPFDFLTKTKDLMAVVIPRDVYKTATWYPDEMASLYFVSNYDVKEVDRQAPVPNVPANYIVNVDDMQTQDQVLSHVIVSDDTDPNPQLVVKSSAYNPSNRTTGTYPIVFYVKDASGNESIDYTLNVVVADVTDPANPEFGKIEQANNVKLSDEQILAKFIVSDNYSSSEAISKFLKKNDYAANWNHVGVYEVICRATDEAGNYTDSTSFIEVKDATAPTNIGSSITVGNSVKLDNVDLMEELFTVSDDTTSVEKIKLSILSDQYSSNWAIPGTYELVCRATDEAGNFTDSTSYILVEDTTLPTLKGQVLDVEYNDPITDLKSLFTYGDDVSAYEDLTFKITSDEYSSSSNYKGTYVIEASVTDEAGNISYSSSVLRVVDRTKPIITIPMTITVGNSAFHSMEEIKSKAVVEDGYDGVITDYSITDNDGYESNYTKVGKYTFTISASDAEGNTQSVTIARIVIDDTTPTVRYDMYVIVLSQGEELTLEMIKSYASQSLGISEAAILSVAGDYNTSALGTYSVKLYMMDGSVQQFSISVGENYNTPSKPKFWSAEGYSFVALFQFNKWTDWTIAIWATWVGVGIALIIGVGAIVYKKKKGGTKRIFR